MTEPPHKRIVVCKADLSRVSQFVRDIDGLANFKTALTGLATWPIAIQAQTEEEAEIIRDLAEDEGLRASVVVGWSLKGKFKS